MSRLSPLFLGFLSIALAFAPSPTAFGEEHDAAAAHAAPHDAAAGPAHGGTAPTPNILELKPSLAISTVVIFFVLFFVLWKFAWGPLSKALHDREHHMEHVLGEAEHARAESERLLAEHRAQMAQAADQIRAMLDEARRGAEASAAEIVKKAQDEADASRERAKRDIATARDQALLEIWSKTADLAVNVAGRVLSKQIDGDEHRRLVEIAMNELPSSPNGAGGRRA